MALFLNPLLQVENASGVPYSGAKLYFYVTETTTTIPIWQDADFSVSHTNPVVADDKGMFPVVYVEEALYKVVLKDANDQTLKTIDPIGQSDIIPFIDSQVITANTTINDTHRGKKLAVTTANVTLTYSAASGYDDRHSNLIHNQTTRMIYVAINGYTPNPIGVWPNQVIAVTNINDVWGVQRNNRYKTPSAGFTLYVDHANGNNNNDGLAAGTGNAKATINAAIDILEGQVDCNDFGPTIQVSSTGATFREDAAVHTHRLHGYHVLYLRGDPSNPSAAPWVVSANSIGFTCRDWSGAIIDGFTMYSDGANAAGCQAANFGILDTLNMRWGLMATGSHIWANDCGSMGCVTGSTAEVIGNCARHWYGTGGSMTCIGAAYNMSSAGLLITAFAQFDAGKLLISNSTPIFTGAGAGTATIGLQINASGAANIQLNGQTIPGSTGVSASGAYIDGVMHSLNVGPQASVEAVSTGGSPVIAGYGGAGVELLVRNATNNIECVMRSSAATVDYGSTVSAAVRLMMSGTARAEVDTTGNFHPTINNTYSLGKASFLWTEVFATNGTINTSDARKKTPVAPLSEIEVLAAKAMAREIGTFQFLQAVAKKGEGARHHVGMTVQRATEIMEGHGLDPMRYGFICYDEWEARPEEQDGKGHVISPAVEAGNSLGFRPEQLLMFIARGFDARLAALEARA